MPIDRTLLKRAEEETRRYAHICRTNRDPLSVHRVRHYVEHLLPLELQCAEADNSSTSRLPEPEHQGGTLALLVGFSVEPLLQSICAYKPDQVILILNSRYGSATEGRSGREYGRGLASYFPSLTPEFLPSELGEKNSTIQIVQLESDHPPDVFRTLRKVLLENGVPRPNSILDVTGGKKSMVTGAFLFGAFAGIGLSYVDFDDYDPGRGAPAGYSCRIGLLQNPYEAFQLREWQTVRDLYGLYSFRRAKELVDRIVEAMSDWFTEDEIEAAARLSGMLEVYESWDHGDFTKAFEKLEEYDQGLLESPVTPTAIRVLGEDAYWPTGNSAHDLMAGIKILEYGEEDQRSLYLDSKRLCAYLKDECEKIGRLIEFNEDHRSALLRTVGLSEVLIRSRLLLLADRDLLEVAVDDGDGVSKEFRGWRATKAEHPEQVDMLSNWIVSSHTIHPLLDCLKYPTKAQSVKDRDRKVWARLRLADGAPCLPSEVVLDRIVRELRNKAVHTYLSVSQEIARGALSKIRCDIDNFVDEWAVLSGESGNYGTSVTFVPEWDKVCDICGIDFLPKNLGEKP